MTGKIAYVIGGDAGPALHLFSLDGSGDRALAKGSEPAWVPNATALLFTAPAPSTGDEPSVGDIWRVRIDGTGVVGLIPDGRAPAMSPDGTTIAFGRGVIDTGDVMLANADGTNVRRLVPGTPPTWSPEGRWLLTNLDTAAFALTLVRPDAAGAPRSLGPGFDPSWTPDGRIVYVRFDDARQAYEIRRVSDEGDRAVLLTWAAPSATPIGLPDGGVVFVSGGDLWRLDPGATSPVRLTSGLSVTGTPSASPDGAWIAVAASRRGLYVVSAKGGWVQLVEGDVTDAAWSPGG
jgi:Tol biopolymer transport system component